jgi:plasmid stabilization system protein ParE
VKTRKRRAQLLITERALRDITDIEKDSISRWGKRVTARYIADIEEALLRLKDRPDLAHPEMDLHSALRFYRVNKHLLVCDVEADAVLLLTVIHASRDITSRLAEMEPTLAAEVEMLHAKLKQAKRR